VAWTNKGYATKEIFIAYKMSIKKIPGEINFLRSEKIVYGDTRYPNK
jgi:hypothetical protein